MLGMLGGGQLGRMFTLAAHSMGYRVTVLDPDPLSPAGAVADVHLKAAYQDREALQQLADTCVAVTTEFENVPADSLRWLASHCTVRPAGDAVAVAQDRIREKTFAADCGARTADWAEVNSRADLDAAITKIGTPAILKTTRFGYDGKGQIMIREGMDIEASWQALGGAPCILEGLVPFARVPRIQE